MRGKEKSASRHFLIAWQFLTILPLSHAHHDPSPRELAASMAWYPVVGLLLGGILVAADAGLSRLAGRGVVELLVIVLLVVLTRGLHQDGLADTLDGLIGGRNPAERLAIMRDGRIGAIGATGLILGLGLRYAALAALPGSGRWPVLLCMPVVGRWSMVVSTAAVPYAGREGGLGEPFAAHLSMKEVAAATSLCVLTLYACLGVVGTGATVVGTGFCVWVLGWLFRRQCGGISGDMLGATNEVTEILFLLLAPLALPLR